MRKRLNSNRVINVGFGAILVILVLLTGANIFIISKNNQTIFNIELKQMQAEDILIMLKVTQQRALYLFQMTVMEDAFDRDDLHSVYSRDALKFINALSHFRDSDSNKTLTEDWNKILALGNLGRATQDMAAELIYVEKMDVARKLLFNEVIPVQKQVISGLVEQYEKRKSLLNNEIGTIRQLNITAYWVISVIGIIAILLGIGIAIYVSRHNKRSSELEVQMQLAEEANEAKTEFLANMSHELRTPIHAILSFSKFGINKDTASNEKIKGYFQRINVSGTRLLSLVTRLLDLEKLESGKTDFNFTKTNLATTLTACLDELSELIKNKNINIMLMFSKSPGIVECDQALIYQVFQNLLANAIKFSSENTDIKIELEVDKVLHRLNGISEVVRFSIEDQGVGIKKEELETVFDKFIQSSTTNTGSGGTGLGLAICAEIIEGHSGKIWAECNKGKGARFIFEIPTTKTIKTRKQRKRES